jgi:hypothetical protein
VAPILRSHLESGASTAAADLGAAVARLVACHWSAAGLPPVVWFEDVCESRLTANAPGGIELSGLVVWGDQSRIQFVEIISCRFTLKAGAPELESYEIQVGSAPWGNRRVRADSPKAALAEVNGRRDLEPAHRFAWSG